MIGENQIIRLIFGFKIKYLRQKHGLSYQELSTKTGLSTSYLNDIEKGKRYPKPDKITSLAQALGVDYNYMVSTNASKKLQPVIDLFQSKLFKLFPLEEFGISPEKLLELFTTTPDKVNAFVSTILKIARNYQVDDKQFYLEALRSYQDMHNNYFPELEQAVQDFVTKEGIKGTVPYTSEFLASKLETVYGITVDKKTMKSKEALGGMRSYFSKENNVLYLQGGLSSSQENFLLAREIGFQFLEIDERPYETTIIDIDSFEHLLNNYKASHFAAALLMEEDELINDIKEWARQNNWDPAFLSTLLTKYDVSPETLMQRLTNILPYHFGIDDLFFIRLTGSKDLMNYKMTKDLHLGQLHNPYNNELNEHYCARWVSVTSIKELHFRKGKNKKNVVVADAQISKYWQTDKEYLCITLAKPAYGNTSTGASVTLGMLVTPHLKSIFHFISDPKLKYREVHTTCERCGIADCDSRVASPIKIEEMEERAFMMKELEEL